HLAMGKNLYSFSRSQDSALYHLLRAAALSQLTDNDVYIKSTLSLGLIAQDSGDYNTALDFINPAIVQKKEVTNDSLVFANYYMLAALVASGKVDGAAATRAYYDSAKIIIEKSKLDDVHYQYFVEGRLARFAGRYQDALDAYNKKSKEFNLLVFTDKIQVF